MNIGDQIEILVDNTQNTTLKKGNILKITDIYSSANMFEVNNSYVLKNNGFIKNEFKMYTNAQTQIQYQVGQQIQIINNANWILNTGDILTINKLYNGCFAAQLVRNAFEFIFNIPQDEGCFNMINSVGIQNGVPNVSVSIPGGIPTGNGWANNTGGWKFLIGDIIKHKQTGYIADVTYIDRITQEYELEMKGSKFLQYKDMVEKYFEFNSTSIQSGAALNFRNIQESVNQIMSVELKQCKHDWRDSRSEGSTKWCSVCGERK